MDVAKLGISIAMTGGAEATRTLNDLAGAAGRTEKQVGGLTGAMGKFAAAFAASTAAALLFNKMLQETIEAQRAMAQLEAVVRSTGGAAGYTANQLADLAGEMQGLTTYSDEAIMSAQSMLLTFTRIGHDVFPAATSAVADLATAMGGDLKGAAIQIGKALNDPITGITALTRVGVSFSESQKSVIKDLVETGRAAEAQRMILKELTTEFGGSAAAARDTLGGALKALNNAFGELFEGSKGSTAAIVDSINSVTKALPAAGSATNRFLFEFNKMLLDATVGWQKFLNLFRNDPGFTEAIDKFRKERFLVISGLAADLEKASQFTKPVGAGGAGAAGDGAQKLKEDARELTLALQGQLDVQNALNAAFGKSSFEIDRITVVQKILNEQKKFAAEHTKDETAAYVALSNQLKESQLLEVYQKEAVVLAEIAFQQERIAKAMGLIAGLGIPGVQYARPGGTRGNIGGPSVAPGGLGTQGAAGQYPTANLFDIPKLGLAANDMVRIAESAARLSDSLGLINRQLGAIVGGVGQIAGGGSVGIAGGIFTIITAVVQGQQQAAAALKQAVDSLNASIASFTGDTSLAGRIAGVSQQATGLRGQAISTYGRIIGESGGRVGQEEFARAMDQINEAEAKRIRLLIEEARVLREEFFTGIDKALAAARGIVDPTLAINEAYRDNIIKASSLGATMEEQARITELYRAQLLQLADAMDKTFSQGLLDRFYAATGGQRSFSQIQTGFDGRTIVPYGQSENAAWFQRFDTYVSGLENQKREAEIVARETAAQTKILQDQLSVAQQTLSVQTAAVSATRQIVDSLRKYGDSLSLGSLSPLSPTDRYLEAKRQYDAIAGLAAGGDKSALASLPETANAFLEASRAMFASSTRYQQDYQQVQTFIGTLSDQYGQQLTTQEKLLAEAQKTNDALQQQIDILNKQLGAQNSQAVLSLVAMANDPNRSAGSLGFVISQLRTLGYTIGQDTADIGGGLRAPVGSYYPVGYGFGPGQNPFAGRNGGTTDANGQYWPAGWGGSDNADVVAEIRGLRDEIREQTRSMRQTATAVKER